LEAGVVVIGSSAAVPAWGRRLPSLAIVYRGSVILLDCGEATQYGLLEHHVSYQKIEAILITHLHGDHFLGIPGLLQTMTMNRRRKPLIIAGPRELKSFIEECIEDSGTWPSFPIAFIDSSSLQPFKLPSGLTVKPFPVRHTTEAYGYLVAEPDKPGKLDLEKAARLGLRPGPLIARLKRGEPVTVNGRVIRPEDVLGPPRRGLRIAYTGDTAPFNIEEHVEPGIDLLIHDATFTSDMAEKAHEQGHSTALDAARAAVSVKTRILLITHFSARYPTPEPLLDEARRIHPYTYAATEGLKIPLRL